MGDSSEKRRQRISEESQFIDSLLTPVALVSGFLLAVTFYLVDIEIRRGGYSYPAIPNEIFLFVLAFCGSLIALDLMVAALVINRIHYQKLGSRGISRSELITIIGFLIFMGTSVSVGYLVPVMAYGLLGFVTEARTLALISAGANFVAYAVSIVIGFFPIRKTRAE